MKENRMSEKSTFHKEKTLFGKEKNPQQHPADKIYFRQQDTVPLSSGCVMFYRMLREYQDSV